MKKPMIIMLIILALIFGAIYLWKAITAHMIHQYFSTHIHTVTVSTTKPKYMQWQQQVIAYGSLRAIRGVNVSPEVAGMVEKIYFQPGKNVKKGQPLVQLNADTEIGQLQALIASAKLAEITYRRDREQFKINAVSKQNLETDFQNFKNLQGQVAAQRAIVVKKTIYAPFSGRVGISQINLGQFLNPGDKITTLQALDPLYIDFSVPEQILPHLKLGSAISLTTDAYPLQSFNAKITTIEPIVESSTRNTTIEAIIENPKYQLIPGMFVEITIKLGALKKYLTLPQTAISFNPYGSIVYLVQKSKQKEQEKGKQRLVANQVLVTTGDNRGEEIAILKGIKDNDIVVARGQVKLKNGDYVVINNKS